MTFRSSFYITYTTTDKSLYWYPLLQVQRLGHHYWKWIGIDLSFWATSQEPKLIYESFASYNGQQNCWDTPSTPPTHSWRVFFFPQVAWTAAQRPWRGWGRKASFYPFWNWQKVRKALWGNFVADCSLYLYSEHIYSPERLSTKCSTKIAFSAKRRMFIGNVICLGHN